MPHSDRANTASFLEEVLKYIDTLKTRVADLEATVDALKSGRMEGHSVGVQVQMSADLEGQPGTLPRSLDGYGTILGDPAQLQLQPSVGYLQQLFLQQQQAGMLAALQVEQQEQRALLEKQKQHAAVARHAMQLAELANQLGLKTLTGQENMDGLGTSASSALQVLSELKTGGKKPESELISPVTSEESGVPRTKKQKGLLL